MNRPEVMLDMESLGVGSDPVILSIGAVMFHRNGCLEPGVEIPLVGDTFHMHLTLDPQVKAGLKISPSTVMWWMKQDAAAREQFSAPKVHPVEALQRFAGWCQKHQAKNIWSYGATADIVWLESLYKAFGLYESLFPFTYRQLRCFRTLAAENPHVPQPEAVGIKHDALDDALFQAQWAQRIFNQQKE